MTTARRAVAVSFFLNGLAFASWASRIPDVRHTLGLSDQALGLLLLGLSLGSVLALPLSGALVHRFGPAAVVRGGCVAVGVALVGIAVGVSGVGLVRATVPFLFCYGIGTSVWDVAMNVEGADVERRLGRSIMPRFHAAFSLGTVAGAGLGALMAHLGPDVTPHLVGIAVVAAAGNLVAASRFLPAAEGPAEPSVGSRGAWREPRTLMIGLVVLVMALTEGTANDWLAVAIKDGYDVAGSVAVLGFALFVSAMTLGRMVGPALLDRAGRVPVLFGTIVLAGVGVLLTVFGSTPWLVVPGIALWGLGASLGFPVGMSAAADDHAHAAARVGVVSTIGYTAFLAGPPLLGFVASEVGTLRALLIVAVLLLPAFLVIPALAPRPPARTV
ncbi:MFS transporter [Nocardioides terrisoli]|uniref:MFS transporter n=1 Tax=Nocardioides terrisoli TaxID=3388267 RepID=UPI00287B5E48|nr:MFS transporter [Nocardioides marmorisolisilvae]